MLRPTPDVPFLKPRGVGGFPLWKISNIAQFEERHPIGSKASLALAPLIYAGGRRSDLVRLGKQDFRGGCLTFRQHKGRTLNPLAIDIPALADLQEVIYGTAIGDIAFLIGEQGWPFTVNGFCGWFRERSDRAGLTGLSARRLRKAAATRAAENGALHIN